MGPSMNYVNIFVKRGRGTEKWRKTYDAQVLKVSSERFISFSFFVNDKKPAVLSLPENDS